MCDHTSITYSVTRYCDQINGIISFPYLSSSCLLHDTWHNAGPPQSLPVQCFSPGFTPTFPATSLSVRFNIPQSFKLFSVCQPFFFHLASSHTLPVMKIWVFGITKKQKQNKNKTKTKQKTKTKPHMFLITVVYYYKHEILGPNYVASFYLDVTNKTVAYFHKSDQSSNTLLCTMFRHIFEV